jgi:hypothetical protein
MREDVREARRLGRIMIVATVVYPFVISFLWIAEPGFTGGFAEPWYVAALPVAAWAVYLAGLSWMIRIYRTSHLEPDTSNWRYRDA